jgi:hypothetical protein
LSSRLCLCCRLRPELKSLHLSRLLKTITPPNVSPELVGSRYVSKPILSMIQIHAGIPPAPLNTRGSQTKYLSTSADRVFLCSCSAWLVLKSPARVWFSCLFLMDREPDRFMKASEPKDRGPGPQKTAKNRS